jgi:hypothetical protein
MTGRPTPAGVTEQLVETAGKHTLPVPGPEQG